MEDIFSENLVISKNEVINTEEEGRTKADREWSIRGLDTRNLPLDHLDTTELCLHRPEPSDPCVSIPHFLLHLTHLQVNSFPTNIGLLTFQRILDTSTNITIKVN